MNHSLLVGENATALLFVVLGLVFGSFASALSHRLPRGEPVVADRSRCPCCGAVLTARDLVPLLSWVIARARCRHCGAPVSWRYPLIELTMAAVFLAAWRCAGGDSAGGILLALTGFGLVVIVVADLEAGIIPDVMLVSMAPVAVVWRWWTGGDWVDAASGAIVAVVVLGAARWAFLAWRGFHGLGMGDVKFVGLAGFYVGLSGFGTFLVLSGVLGILFGLVWRLSGRGRAFPFGPGLCVALLLAVFWPGVFGGDLKIP